MEHFILFYFLNNAEKDQVEVKGEQCKDWKCNFWNILELRILSLCSNAEVNKSIYLSIHSKDYNFDIYE